MPQYRKKPVVIDAIQWTGDNIEEVAKFLGNRNFSWDKLHGLQIHTLEGTHRATISDQIIKGVQGEFYPCKLDIFESTYEAV